MGLNSYGLLPFLLLIATAVASKNVTMDVFNDLDRKVFSVDSTQRFKRCSDLDGDAAVDSAGGMRSKFMTCLELPNLGGSSPAEVPQHRDRSVLIDDDDEDPPTSVESTAVIDLYSNSIDMLALAAYIYEIVEMRRQARLNNNDELFQSLDGSPSNPTNFHDIQDILRQNLEPMYENEQIDDALELLGTYLADASDGVDEDIAKETLSGSRLLVHMEDEKHHVDQSRVHAIVVNDRKKRIEVVFRGTTNTTPKNAWKDWSTNLNAMFMRTFENPVSDLRSVMPKLRLHRGFSKVMFGRKSKLDKDKDCSKVTTPFEEIVCKIKGVWKEGYSLYVTGHSLGGATATLFAFLAAAYEEEFSKTEPVTIYTYASPRVGGQGFREAFKYLEQKGRLRHARLHNENDKVPLLPWMLGIYKHVGLEFRLRHRYPIVVDYPAYLGWTQGRVSLMERLRTFPDFLSFHSCTEMMNRLRRSRAVLLKTTLEEEYWAMWGIE